MKGTASEVVKTAEALLADAHAVSSIDGADIDCEGFRELLIHAIISDVGGGGTVDMKIQEADENATVPDTAGTYADVTDGALAQITVAGKARISVDLEKRKRFIRLVTTIGTNAVDAAASATLSQPQYPPVTQEAGETLLVN